VISADAHAGQAAINPGAGVAVIAWSSVLAGWTGTSTGCRIRTCRVVALIDWGADYSIRTDASPLMQESPWCNGFRRGTESHRRARGLSTGRLPGRTCRRHGTGRAPASCWLHSGTAPDHAGVGLRTEVEVVARGALARGWATQVLAVSSHAPELHWSPSSEQSRAPP